MPIYYAEMNAEILLPEHIGDPKARGMLVQYLFVASDLDSAVDMVSVHAYEHYLDQGELVECYEVDRVDALNHPVTADRGLDIDSPELFEVITLGSYGNTKDGWLKRCWLWFSDLF